MYKRDTHNSITKVQSITEMKNNIHFNNDVYFNFPSETKLNDCELLFMFLNYYF